MSQFRTHYDNLQVKETASDEVIKGAYRYLSQKWHPDRNPHNRQEAERVIKIINEAYAVLSDPIRRKEYDAWIKREREGENEQAQNPSPPPHAQPQNNEERAAPPLERKKSRTKDTIGFWLQGALALVLVKTVGFFGAIASFISYYWLKPKIGIVGALVCSVILGIGIGLVAMTLFTKGTSTPNNAPHRTGESAYSVAADRPPAQKDRVHPSNVDGVKTDRPQPNQRELLKMFVNEFVVNNQSFHYPIKINEQTYLIGRSISDDGDKMFVVEDYRISTATTPTIGQVLDAMEETENRVTEIFCGSLEDRDQLFLGYSSVGIIQNIADANGNRLFKVVVDKSNCS